MRRTAVTMLLLAVGALPARAQQGVAVGAAAYFVQQSSASNSGTQTGTWGGVEGRWRRNRVSIEAAYLAGPLGGDPTRVDRDARQTDVAVHLRMNRWLELSAQGQALNQSSSVANSTWRLFGVGARVGTSLGVPGLWARAEVAVYPVASAVGSDDPKLPRRVDVGLGYRLGGVPIELDLAYRMETLDFSGVADLRLGGPMLRVRLGR